MKTRLIFVLLLALALIGLFIFPTTPPQFVGVATLPSITTSSESYKHFNGAFTMRLPVGWAVNVRDDGLLVSEPQGGGVIDLEVINTALPLDAPALARYVDAVEENFFATSANYHLLERRTTQDGCQLVRKNLDVKGVTQLVVSYYCSLGNVVTQHDFWAVANRVDGYATLYETVLKSLQVDTKVMQAFQPYREKYFFVDPSRRFEFRVPYSWMRRSQVDGGNTLETFTAPDNFSAVQHLRVDVGRTVAQDQLTVFALGEVRRVNNLDNMRQGEPQLRSGDLWQVTWTSNRVSGKTLFRSNGNMVYTWSWLVQADQQPNFATLGAELLDSYRVIK